MPVLPDVACAGVKPWKAHVAITHARTLARFVRLYLAPPVGKLGGVPDLEWH
jgi:hypothetical protein